MTSMAARRPPRLSVALCILGLGMAPLSLPAQTPDIPVLVIEEPTPKPIAERVRLNPVRELSWSDARELLAAENLPAPARPSEFTLTPRDPYRMPGGVIRLHGYGDGQTGPWWQPADPDPTGSVRMDDDNAVWLHLLQLKPDYKYAIDLSLSSFEPARLKVGPCMLTGTLWSVNAEVDGPGHVLFAISTDREGEACLRLTSAAETRTINLQRATISELGPRPSTRLKPQSRF